MKIKQTMKHMCLNACRNATLYFNFILITLKHISCALQDTLGGRFDATQSFVGEMSDVQLWSRVLNSQEINNQASCSRHLTGDVITWNESIVELHGGVTKYPFDPCQ